jgi:hypothetical protein
MPNFKFTIKYGGHGFGPTESFFAQPTSIKRFVLTLNNYLKLRQQMLFPELEITGIRIGRTGLSSALSDGRDPTRQSTFYPAGETFDFEDSGNALTVPNAGTYLGPTGSRGPAFANVSINERIQFNDNRFATRYIPFCPALDLGADKAGGNLGTDTKWFDLLKALQNMWIGKGEGDFTGEPFYIKALARTGNATPKTILKWVTQTPTGGNIGAVIAASDNGGYASGVEVFIHGTRRRPEPKVGGPIKLQSLNGNWRVDTVQNDSPITGQTTIFLQNTSGIDVTTVKKTGTISLKLYALFPIQDAFAVRTRTHKRGKDTTVPAGRRLTRVSADP